MRRIKSTLIKIVFKKLNRSSPDPGHITHQSLEISEKTPPPRAESILNRWKYLLFTAFAIALAAPGGTALADTVYDITGSFTYCEYGPCPDGTVTILPGSTIAYNTLLGPTIMATAVNIVLQDAELDYSAVFNYLPSASPGCGSGCYLNVNNATATEWYGSNPALDSYLNLQGVDSALEGTAVIGRSGPDILPEQDWNLDGTYQLTPVTTPEPGMMSLVGLGLAGLVAAAILRSRGRQAAKMALGALFVAEMAHANVVTFDYPSLWAPVEPNVYSYTEDGMRVLWYSSDGCVPVYTGPPPAPCGGQGLVANGAGWALSTRNFVDIVFEPVDGGTFTPISMDFLGGTDTRFGGFDLGDFQAGGETPDTQILLNGAGSQILFDSSWQNIAVIDWCDYCIEYGFNGGIIDNLVFTLGTPMPEPDAGALTGTGLLLIAARACLSGARTGRRAWDTETSCRRACAATTATSVSHCEPDACSQSLAASCSA